MPHPLLTAFAAMRLTVGAGTWLSPRTSARLFGLPADSSPILGRLFGAREAALALGALSPDARVRRTALGAGIAIDGADTVASLLDLAAGKMTPRAGILVGGGAAVFAALGVASLRV
ncbi:hypothetical protein [Mycobacterium sp. Marseille-P9652]|uniref:hypothetical protein n=1 Tax=Mycobacterium sp. Marseille-P9652 TaxID=2654950 RepID=UPI0012E89D3F|nr:hypothetical protein [Mycobacterium sp. Marseille-P9652]